MIPKQSKTGAIVIVVILAILIIVGIVLIFTFQKQYSDCKNKESPLCLTGNCPKTTDACGPSPFKFSNGQIVCKNAIFSPSQVPTVSPLAS